MLTRCKKTMDICTSRAFISGPAASTLIGQLAVALGPQVWMDEDAQPLTPSLAILPLLFAPVYPLPTLTDIAERRTRYGHAPTSSTSADSDIEMRTAIGNSALHDHEYRESLIACHWPSFCTLVLSHFAPGTSCISCLVPLAFRISCFSIWCCILFAFCTWYTYICLPSVFRTYFYKFTPIMCSNRGSQREGMQECS
ncbi:hypothetical protein EDD17DRAFT_1531362 [Pisolithus thermaeus]|nr:hypothetical protein EDD17DRAFT_1531362 [Pisolithus thermaeus]